MKFVNTKQVEASLPDYDISTRPSLREDEIELKVEPKSMSLEEASDRLIDPENVVMGGKASASMYEFVPSENVKGAEDFVEEEDYFARYSAAKAKSIPFNFVPQGAYEFPQKLDVFTYPHGVFDHFEPPKRLYGEFEIKNDSI